MAKQQFDGVIEAVHYRPDGQVDWVRAYLRRGSAWSDRLILTRSDLIQEIKAGKRMMLGQRVQYMAGTFDVTTPVKVVGQDGQEVLATSSGTAERDQLEGAPVL
jgi:hypothetical protein